MLQIKFFFQKAKKILLESNILLILSIFILFLGFSARIKEMSIYESGGDDRVHQDAVLTFLDGNSPYDFTVEGFENLDEDTSTEKGYAYFPAILYIYTILYKISQIFLNGPYIMHLFYRLPGVLAHLFVGILLIKYFYSQKKPDKLAMFYTVFYWTFDYFFLARSSLARFDALPVLFLFLAVSNLQKSDIKAGIFFSISVLFKTFSVILFPLFIFKSKKPLKFLFWGFLTAFIFSLPFITSWDNLVTYIHGALFVHSERYVQGRPFLYYLSYLFSLELIQIISFNFYSIGSIVFGWVFLVINKIGKFFEDNFTISIFPFLIFYLITPVLNRTFLLWWIPFLLVGSYNFFKGKWKFCFYLVTGLMLSLIHISEPTRPY